MLKAWPEIYVLEYMYWSTIHIKVLLSYKQHLHILLSSHKNKRVGSEVALIRVERWTEAYKLLKEPFYVRRFLNSVAKISFIWFDLWNLSLKCFLLPLTKIIFDISYKSSEFLKVLFCSSGYSQYLLSRQLTQIGLICS